MNDKTIVGYIEQTQEQIKMINEFKRREEELVLFVDALGMEHMDGDKRWLAIAKTHFQQGFMAAVRAIARPKGD